MCDVDNSDEEYDYSGDPHHPSIEKKYPLHDCCEFDDVDALKELVYVTSDDEEEDEGDGDDDDDDDQSEDHSNGMIIAQDSKDDSSSTDENDSTAAAHAAAIGHSPQPIKPAISTSGELFNALESKDPRQNEIGKVDLPISRDGPKKMNGESKVEITSQIKSVGNLVMETIKAEQQTVDDSEKNLCITESLSSLVDNKTVDSSKEDIPQSSAQESISADPMNVDSVKTNHVQKNTDIEGHKLNGTAVGSTLNDNKKNCGKPPSPRLKRKRVVPERYLNERDDDENTALHIAIHCRKIDHVRVLLEAGASLLMKCDGSLPIHTAISLGSIRTHQQFAYDCVVLLHEHGADLAAKDESVHTPLYLACMFNLPQVVSYILSDTNGQASLNRPADRAGNTPLHAAAKFDTLENPSFSKTAASCATGQIRLVHHHHPDGSVVNSMHAIPGFRGKLENVAHRTGFVATETIDSSLVGPSTEALLTQVLLGIQGIEVDATNVMEQTPLHVACFRGNWPVVRLLIQADADTQITDRRGFTPGQLAYKRGMPIPNDLVMMLGDPPETGILPPPRDLIVDPNGSTLLLSHELCLLHRTCPPIRRDSPEPPPENVRRLSVLLDKESGILRSGEFVSLVWNQECRRAAMSDVLKVHEYSYIEKVSQMTSAIPDHPNAIAHLDADTAISRWSFEAALRAAGAICQAVDRVVAGECRNAFCAVRPPGHHAGPRGIVKCANDVDGGSHGFCLLNNVAIGAAYARCMYRNEGIRKIAIIDFDVHHGNGTEAILRNLVPTTERATIRTPFAVGDISTTTYRPWLDETDIKNIFFASTHGYGNRGYDQPGWFYPASGKTHTSEAITHPAMVENPSLGDFILSQTWSRMGEESLMNCCKIINVGLPLPEPDADPQARSMKQRLELRETYRKNILPNLRDFDPDLIFISAGFDAHKKDTMNFGYVGMVEDDYEWITEQLVKVANTCCNGRIVSVLEGGYKMHGGIISPFARSAASHIRSLVDGGRSRELYDQQDCEFESQFEKRLYERRERKREQKREQIRLLEEKNLRSNNTGEHWSIHGDVPDDPDAPIGRKRRRNQVDYKELFRKMQEEGFAG